MSGDTGGAKKSGAKETFGAAKKAFNDSKSNDNQNSGQVDDNQEEAGSVQDTAKSSGKGKEGAKKTKDAVKRGKKVFNGLKGIQGLAPLVSALGSIAIALLIIFLIIGFIGFFTTLPGLAMEKITEACKKFWDWVKGAEKIDISQDDLVDLANYIQELGYELVGNGFASSSQIERDKDTGEVTAVKTDYEGNPGDTPNYLYAYVLQNERMYTLRGVKKSAGSKIFTFVPFIGKLADKIENSIRNSKYTNNKSEYGMLHFDKMNKDWWNNLDDFQVEIDRDDMKLKIKTHSGFLGWRVDQMNWDLDGWTGRYGKPIELSLALHLSTMAPDFVYDFCMDDALQTDVELSTQEVEYTVDYTYFPNTDPELKVTKDEVIAEFEKQKETMNVQKIHNLMFDKDHKITGNAWYWMEDDGFARMCPPIDIIESTSIYRIDDNRVDPPIQNYYTLQEQLYTSNSLNYLVWKVDDDTPEVYSNLDNVDLINKNAAFTLADIIQFRSDGIWEIVDGYGIHIEAISMEDMLSILNSEGNYEAKRAVLKYLSQDIGQGEDTYNDYGFKSLMYCIDATIKLIRETDSNAGFHDTSYGYEGRYVGGIQGTPYYGYDFFGEELSLEDIQASSLYVVEFLTELRDDIRKDMDKIEYYTQVIINNNLKEVEEWGLSGEEFRLLYEIMVEQDSNVHTFKPYIKKVTNHWYKDVYFMPEAGKTPTDWGKAYDFTKEIEDETGEYNPEGLANTDDIQKLKEKGTIMYTLNGTGKHNKDVTQIKQPYIIRTEPWHNKVKNWLTSGYFFIYDGTIETAREIESARKVLKNKYDPSNPLLISYGNKELLVDSENNEKPEVAEIDKKAKELNDILASTEYKDGKKYKVRLQKINFAKKSSLAAFSILESVHTKDGEYVYRDLKEFMIELGYFTEADFKLIESGVLDWIIPEYVPDEWPDKKYEKKNDEYGTFIRSRTSIEAERAEEEKKLEEASKREEQIADGNTGSSDGNADSNQPENNDANNQGENKDENSGNKNQTVSRSAVYQEYAQSGEGYQTIITVNGISYKNYKQGDFSDPNKYSYSEGTIATSGCGATSTAIVLTGYGYDVGVPEVANWIKANSTPTSWDANQKALEHFGGVTSQVYVRWKRRYSNLCK